MNTADEWRAIATTIETIEDAVRSLRGHVRAPEELSSVDLTPLSAGLVDVLKQLECIEGMQSTKQKELK